MNESLALPLAAGSTARPEFWRSHALYPGVALFAAFLALEAFGLDRSLARSLYFDAASQQWLGAGAGRWWARDLLHDGGRWLVRGVAFVALLAWLASFRSDALRPWRRQALFVFASMVTAVTVVGVLKSVTGVDCPWDLQGFGGTRPYVPLFADRPNYLPRAACFPGAHASSGFSLLCFYLLLRDRNIRWARWALAGALLVGIAFSVGQEARGAHFLSHDLAAAALVWFILLGWYRWLLGGASR